MGEEMRETARGVEHGEQSEEGKGCENWRETHRRKEDQDGCKDPGIRLKKVRVRGRAGTELPAQTIQKKDTPS